MHKGAVKKRRERLLSRVRRPLKNLCFFQHFTRSNPRAVHLGRRNSMDISTPHIGGFTNVMPLSRRWRSLGRGRRGPGALIAGLAVTLAAPLAGCTRSESPPSVLVIVVDTLRADHVGALTPPGASGSGLFAGRGSPTPTIDRWAAEGARFERAVTPAPFTMPAMAALWTGAYPDRTGVVAHEPGTTLDTWPGATLAETARRAGLATAAVVANPWLGRRRTRFDRGFEDFVRLHGPNRKGNRRRATAVTDQAIALLDRLADQRFLVWAHYFDPHMPYDPPPRFAEAAAARPGPSRVVTEFRRKNRNLRRLYRGEDFDADEVEQARRLYEGEVRYTDTEVGRLLDHLESLGRARDTIVVLASDHGESLGEHDLYFAHDHTLYEELTRVALIVSGPGIDGAGRPDRVSLIDVAPTVCRLADLGCEQDFDGRDLFVEAPAARTLFAAATPLRTGGPDLYEGQIPGLRGRSLMALGGDTKFIRTPTSSGTVLELYDLGADPAEETNLAGTGADPQETLARDLQNWSAQMTSQRPASAPSPGPRRSRRESEALRSLGYLQ